MEDVYFRVNEIIEQEIRPLLHDHKGDITLVSVVDGVANVKFLGACRGCPGAQMTINDMVELKITEKIPEVKKVVLVNDISRDMVDMAKKILGKK